MAHVAAWLAFSCGASPPLVTPELHDMRPFALALLAAAALAPLRAHADASMGVIATEIAYASDYRFDGLSSSDNEPVWQGYVYWWRPDNWFAGVFASEAHYRGFGDASTSYELDVWAGRHFDEGRRRITLDAMYSIFPDNETFGPTYDFLQLRAKALRRGERLAYGGSLSFSPEASYRAGDAWRVHAEAAYTARPWLTFSGGVGQRWVQKGHDRAFWDAGATFRRGPVALDLRYYDTDLSRRECFFTDRCDGAFVARVSFNPPFLPLYDTTPDERAD
jgi:uncharacterized protein (TIGR02001 family)